MNEKDKLLLEAYKQGFNDGLNNVDDYLILVLAYNLGQLDAQVGDDVRSVDYQTDEEILERIKDKV